MQRRRQLNKDQQTEHWRPTPSTAVLRPLPRMRKAPMASVKEQACSRLAALRSNHDLCDASIVVQGQRLPIHLALVAEISPVFKKALCGDFKEGRNKTLVLSLSSPAVVNIILDYAYGVFARKQLADFDLCLQVWRDGHMYQIEGLCEEAAKVAFREVTVNNLVDLVHHATMYGTDADYSSACRLVAYHFNETARSCRSFASLRFHEMVQILRSNYLIGREDDILTSTLQWVKQNPAAEKYEIDSLLACIRIERLTDLDRIEALCASATCPLSLVRQSTRICFHRMKAELAMARVGRVVNIVHPKSSRFFVNGQDCLRGNRTHFTCGNLAMAAWIDLQTNLCLKVDHLVRRPTGKRSLQQEVANARLSVYVVECSQGQDACMQNVTNSVVDFEDGAFGGQVKLPSSKLPIEERVFWVFALHKAEVVPSAFPCPSCFTVPPSECDSPCRCGRQFPKAEAVFSPSSVRVGGFDDSDDDDFYEDGNAGNGEVAGNVGYAGAGPSAGPFNESAGNANASANTASDQNHEGDGGAVANWTSSFQDINGIGFGMGGSMIGQSFVQAAVAAAAAGVDIDTMYPFDFTAPGDSHDGEEDAAASDSFADEDGGDEDLDAAYEEGDDAQEFDSYAGGDDEGQDFESYAGGDDDGQDLDSYAGGDDDVFDFDSYDEGEDDGLDFDSFGEEDDFDEGGDLE